MTTYFVAGITGNVDGAARPGCWQTGIRAVVRNLGKTPGLLLVPVGFRTGLLSTTAWW